LSDFRISTNVNEMDFDVIHGFVTKSYWAAGIPAETLRRAMENSLNFAVLTALGQQVGFARVITDCATFAYLADVFIIESHRAQGLSKLLLAAIMNDPRLQGLRRFMLGTRDAHSLYEQFGFARLANPETFMQCWNPEVYQSNSLN